MNVALQERVKGIPRKQWHAAFWEISIISLPEYEVQNRKEAEVS